MDNLSHRTEIICGSMFAGKTEELMRRLKRAKIARQNVVLFKPNIDTRYDKNEVVSHDQVRMPAIVIPSDAPKQIYTYIDLTTHVVGIDEVQFFDPAIVKVINTLADEGKRVIVAGLDTDFEGKPFENIPPLLATSDEIVQLHAVCLKCGALASRSHRLTTSKATVQLGAQGEYEPLCRKCYVIATNS